MILVLVALLFGLVGLAEAAETACSRSDVVLCLDFEAFNSAQCLANGPTSDDCWIANGHTQTFGDTNWPIVGGDGQAAAGNGYVTSNLTSGSSGPGRIRWFASPNGMKGRLRYYRKFSGGVSIWNEGHGNGFWVRNNGTGAEQDMKLQTGIDGTVYSVGSCAPERNHIDPNVANAPVPRWNRWHRIEMYGEIDDSCSDPNSPTGCNGILQIKIDGQLTHDYSDINYGGVLNGCRFQGFTGPQWYAHLNIAPWSNQKLSYDNFVFATVPNKGDSFPEIGAASDENPNLGTADLVSPYGHHATTLAFHGHRSQGDCDATNSFLGLPGSPPNPPYRSGGTLALSSDGEPAKGGYPLGCVNTVEFQNAYINALSSNMPVGALWRVSNALDTNTCTTAGSPGVEATCKTSGNPPSATLIAVPNGTDASMKVNLTSNSDGGGAAFFLSNVKRGPSQVGWTPPRRVVQGWIYIPSTMQTKVEGATELAFSGINRGSAGLGPHYVALSVTSTSRGDGTTGNWSIRQRHNSGSPATVAASTTPVTYNTWNQYELHVIEGTPDSARLLINGSWVITTTALPNEVDSWAFQNAGVGADDSAIIGVIDFQGTAPLTAYFDDSNTGTMSFVTCEGWDSSSCPFTAAAPAILRGGLNVRGGVKVR